MEELFPRWKMDEESSSSSSRPTAQSCCHRALNDLGARADWSTAPAQEPVRPIGSLRFAAQLPIRPGVFYSIYGLPRGPILTPSTPLMF